MTAQLYPQTICALASGAGRAGVAVIRLSGPHAGPALKALSGPLPSPRQAALRTLRAGQGVAIDQALVLWFPAPASFTGEDIAELHVHGGQAVIAATLDALLSLPGLRLAEPGEFTRRAFEHGKLDLTEAEGLADLVDAETEGQRRQALRQLQGGLKGLYDGWRSELLAAIALIEAEIDFPDEDLPEGLASRAAPQIEALAQNLCAHLDDHRRGERVRDGYRVAIIGAPNAGKSSLLNALAGREAAIVSPIPGTTRDVVEVRLVLAGFPVWVADTAGLREAADIIEAEGVKRALARAEEADLRLIVVDAADPAPIPDAALPHDIIVWNKIDLALSVLPREAELSAQKADEGGVGSDPPPQSRSARQLGPPGEQEGFPLSTRTGDGLPALITALSDRIEKALGARETPALSRARHRALVAQAADELTAALRAPAPELAGEHLRRAADALGRLTGRIDVEEVLGEIFGRFCIGK
jgi:tRNA modification GTPase